MARSKSIAPFLILGGLGLAMVASKKKALSTALGVEVGEGCSKIEIIDQPSFEVYMLDVYTQKRAENVEDQFEIANAIVQGVHSGCRGFPDDVRSEGELDLYTNAVRFATIELGKEMGLANALSHEAAADYGRWIENQTARIHGVPQDPVTVMFAEDGDVISPGPRWVDEVFYPTLQEVEQSTPMLMTEGTAVAVAAIVMQNTIFVNEDGDVIEVDVKSSEAGQEFLNKVIEMIQRYIADRE